jgi:glycosyltransferase involved in cell wall biosynthesis
MRILMITDVYFPRINGVSTSIRTFVTELEKHGHRVTLIAPSYTDDDYDSEQEEFISEIIRIPSRRVPFDPEDRLMKQRLLATHFRQLSRRQYDILHIQTPFRAHYSGVRLARKLNIPVVETYHTYFEEYLHHYFRFLPRSLLKAMARRYTRAQSKSVSALLVPSTAMYKVMANYGVTTPMYVLPTGLDASCFGHGDGQRFRRKHHIDFDRPLLCHVGRSAHEKNIDFLLEMLVLVKAAISEVLLILAGEGPARRHLETKTRSLDLSENVRFIDYLDRDTDLKDCYHAGDIFVFASRTETQGLVLLEAMALGVPVISTAVLGTIDILQPEKGAIIAEEDLEDFSSKVIGLLQDKSTRHIKSLEAVDYASSWSAQGTASRLIELYKTVIDHRQAAPMATPAPGDSAHDQIH